MREHSDLPLAPAEVDTYYWYSADPIEVRVGDGDWIEAVQGSDPNGAAAWGITFAGPEVQDPPVDSVMLGYGKNRIAARKAGTDEVFENGEGGWDIFVGTPGFWVSPLDPRTLSAIVTGFEDPSYSGEGLVDWSVELSLKVAQDILAGLTGNRFHPAGKTTEDFRAVPVATRLNPNYQPITRVISITRETSWASYTTSLATPIPDGQWRIHGGSVLISNPSASYYNACGSVGTAEEFVSLTYTYGSTITASARNALLYLARQIWLSINPEQGSCELPDRITNVNREGLSYTLIDPQQYLDKGRIGIPKIDLWLTTVNPLSARARAAVYTPDSPPGVRGRRA